MILGIKFRKVQSRIPKGRDQHSWKEKIPKTKIQIPKGERRKEKIPKANPEESGPAKLEVNRDTKGFKTVVPEL